MDIRITKTQQSTLPAQDFSHLTGQDFGLYHTDHMFVADYDQGTWQNPRILPYGPMSFAPSLAALHYGQAVFEGMKAQRTVNGTIGIFRMEDHALRFNQSAERLCMPQLPVDWFNQAIATLLAVDAAWIPAQEGAGVYIRPFMFATDEKIKASPSQKYRFVVFFCVLTPYFSKPLRVLAEDVYSRSAPGGIGFAKAAGNYAGGFLPTQLALQKGFDQVIWLDCDTHTIVQECGVMNVMLVINGTYVTPRIDAGTILGGITRDTAIQLLRHGGKKVEERDISMQEICEAAANGSLEEMFGLGTAVTVCGIETIDYKGKTIRVAGANTTHMQWVGDQIMAARLAKELPEPFRHWVTEL